MGAFLYGFADFNDTCMLTPDAIPRFTIGFRALPEGTVPKGPHAKGITIQTHGLNKHGRTLADVRLLDGTPVNYTLVKDGWCWWYWKYPPRNTELARIEKHAREAKTGLWVGQTHIPPWEWRKRSR